MWYLLPQAMNILLEFVVAYSYWFTNYNVIFESLGEKAICSVDPVISMMKERRVYTMFIL